MVGLGGWVWNCVVVVGGGIGLGLVGWCSVGGYCIYFCMCMW